MPGVTLAGSYIGELERNYNPGLVTPRLETGYNGLLELSLTVDTAKAGLWPGGTLYIQGMHIRSDQLSRYVIGELQIASNIEAPPQLILEEAWYEQQWMQGKLSLLAGLRDLGNDFYVSEYAALFLNSSFGTAPVISDNVPFPIYPRSGLAARLRVQPTPQWYLQIADADGNPRTQALSAHEGQTWLAETGYMRPTARYKLGAWLYTKSKTYGGQTYPNDYGYYVLADQQLADFGAMKIGAFVQYAWAPPGRNQITRDLGLGLHVRAPLPGRTKDILGLGLVEAATHTGTESTIELTYRAVISPHIAIQPAFQWIGNPGGTAGTPLIRVGLLRFELSF
jgi:porin